MAVAGVGTILKQGTKAIGGITSIGGLALSADTIDSTTLASTGGYREFIAGFKDAGEVSISGHLDLTSATNQKAIYDSYQSGSVEEYTIEFPTELNASWNFSAVVTGFETGVELEDVVSFDATLKVSGAPTLTITTP